jgi:hypothetical protein
MTMDARYAASASGSSHIKPTDLFGGELEKFALTETAGYSACHIRDIKFLPQAQKQTLTDDCYPEEEHINSEIFIVSETL